MLDMRGNANRQEYERRLVDFFEQHLVRGAASP